MKSPRTKLCARFAAFYLALPAAAFAQTPKPSEPVTARADEAQKLFKQAEARAKAKDWAGTYELLKKSFELLPASETATNLGQAAYKLGKRAEAAHYVAFGLRTLSPTVPVTTRDRARRMYDAMKKEVLELSLTVEPSSAEIIVDGENLGEASKLLDPVFVDGGSHIVEARARGFVSRTEIVRGQAGDRRTLAIELEATMPSPGVPSAAGGGTQDDASRVAPGDAGTPAETTQGGMPAKTIAVVTGMSLTALAAGAAIGFSIDAKTSKDDERALDSEADAKLGNGGCAQTPSDPICTKLADVYDHTNRSRTISTVGWVAAGTFGVATAAVWLLWPERSERAGELQISPAVGSVSGVSVVGRF